MRPSPTEMERDILAMELAVGLMYERGADGAEEEEEVDDFLGVTAEGAAAAVEVMATVSCWGDLGEAGLGL